ncbi:DNA-binding tfar19-related protein, partial [Globisporangium splendens]
MLLEKSVLNSVGHTMCDPKVFLQKCRIIKCIKPFKTQERSHEDPITMSGAGANARVVDFAGATTGSPRALIAIVKPEKARAIEDMVIQMAQRGQLAAKIDEDKLIDLLNRAGETEEKQRTKVTMKRRTYFSDEDDDDDDDF